VALLLPVHDPSLQLRQGSVSHESGCDGKRLHLHRISPEVNGS
jgi:hypothetical protein